VKDTLLQGKKYVDNRSFDMNAVRGFEFDDMEDDDEKAIVFQRYLPDLMTLGMYMYSKTIRHYPKMAIPIFKKIQIRSPNRWSKIDMTNIEIDVDELWSRY
jgi:hypothetical protein